MRKILKLLKKLRSSKTKLSDIFHFSVGNYRYKLYYFRKYKQSYPIIRYIVLLFLLRVHIEEQIEYRIQWMDRECYDNGECKLCGCTTTALQMCNKSCDKPCYPAMMSYSKWKAYKKGSSFRDINGIWLALLSQNLKPILFKETTYGFTPQMDIKPLQEDYIQKQTSQTDYSAGKY